MKRRWTFLLITALIAGSILIGARYYYSKTKERITFEYILFGGWNDGEEDIRRLVKLTRSVPCKINIIPYHDIAFAGPPPFAATLRASSREHTEEFVSRLRDAHVTVFVRSSAGEDIDAACGQLAIKSERKRAPRPQAKRRAEKT